MKENGFRKGMVYAIVVLFIGASIIPLTGSSVVVENVNNENRTLMIEYYTLNVYVDGCGWVEPFPIPPYPPGTIIELTAIPCPGWMFDHWSGDIHSYDNPICITMDSDMSITAHFWYTPPIEIIGCGNVIKEPDQPEYPNSASVQLTAVPDDGWEFDAWSGDIIGSDNPIILVVRDDMTEGVTATFTETGILYVGGDGPGNYSRIQDAIDNASDGNTVFVFDDSSPYYEHVVVDKTVNLIGEDKDMTIIDGGGNGDIVNIATDDVNINGFTVRNGDKGISIESYDYYISSNCNISNCDIYDTSCGIYTYLWSSYNDIFNCSIHNNDYGIHLDYSPRDIYGDGVIDFGDVIDWLLYYSPCYNDILNCDIYNNSYGIYLNNCETDFQVDNANTIGGIMAFSPYAVLENTISNCDIYSNSNGISLLLSGGNTITGNTITSNSEYGISFGSSSNNVITDNDISNNDGGINLHEAVIRVWVEWWPLDTPLGPSNNSLLYHNNFINNSQNARDKYNNIWDNGYPSGGNYWDDYDGSDNYHGPGQNIPGSDGIGDTPYEIQGGNNKDNYPLMETRSDDTTSPEITNVTMITSDPLDTELGFCWENISCTITDDEGVDTVRFVVIYPDDHAESLLMNKIGDTYYYNTSLADVGNYSYHIWANDTNRNIAESSSEKFSLPPNWDVDMNGQVYFSDLIAIVMMYGDTGPPGWIREDVNNDGRVDFDDLIHVVLHYREEW